MSRSARVIGVRLSGLVVRDEEKRVHTIPWVDLTGPHSGDLRPTELARLRDPGLPTRIRGLLRIGPKSIESLRARAMARQLREGRHDRVWRLEPEIRRGWIASIVAFSTAVTLSTLYAYLRYTANSIGPGHEADELHELAWRLSWMGTISVGFIGLLLVSLPAITRLLASRTREILGVRTTSAGIRYVVADGTEVLQPWANAVDGKSQFVQYPKGLLVVDRAAPRSDWRALGNAARRFLGQRQEEKPLRRQARNNILGAILITAFQYSLVLVAAICDDGSPQSRTPVAQVVALSLMSAFACGGGWLVVIWDSGLQRVLRVLGLVRNRRVRA